MPYSLDRRRIGVRQSYPGSRQFDGVNQYFTAADNTTHSIPSVHTAFWINAWGYADSVSGVAGIFAQYTTTGNQRAYALYRNGDKLNFAISSDGTGGGFKGKQFNAASIVVSTFFNACAYHDPDADVIGISLNGAAFETIAHTTGVHNSTGEVTIGRYAGANYWDGRLASVAFAKPPSVPTWNTLRDDFYNSGIARLVFEEVSDANRTSYGLDSGNGTFYNLDEQASSNALNAVVPGTVDMTRTNGVTSQQGF